MWIVIQHLRYRRASLAAEAQLLRMPLPPDPDLPHVLVQIPTFNEGHLVRRAVEAAANLDWPRDRLHIQVVDDSTDGSEALATEAVAALRQRGIDAMLLHRKNRTGFKAGALAEGLKQVDYPFVAVFDADYVPSADFLRACMRPMLVDARLGLVQARIDYLNANENAVTRVQQRILDAHFGIEQATRAWSGQVMPFNGTCGVWRRAALDEAGGWHGDTLAEDLDLSYRVQLRGWRPLFLVSVAVPGELPATVKTWQTQQFRWTKGFAEVARKLLPAVWRSDFTLGQKIMSTLHLGGSAFGPLIGIAVVSGMIDLTVGVGLTALSAALIALILLQGLGVLMAMMLLGQQLIRGANMRDEVKRFPEAIAMFLYGAVANLRGAFDAFAGHATAFVRTPKKSAADPTIAEVSRDG